MRISLKFKTGSFLLKSLPFPNTLTLVCPQSPSLPGLKDQKGQRGYMQPCQPLENKHLNGQMKKKKRKKKQVLCHDSPYLSNDLVYTMSEICYACIGSCRHRYMNMKSESLSLESKQEHPISWVRAEPLPPPAPSCLLSWATESSAPSAQFLSRVLCSKVSCMAVLHHHVLLLRFGSGRPMGFLKITNFFSRVRADPPGLVV